MCKNCCTVAICVVMIYRLVIHQSKLCDGSHYTCRTRRDWIFQMKILSLSVICPCNEPKQMKIYSKFSIFYGDCLGRSSIPQINMAAMLEQQYVCAVPCTLCVHIPPLLGFFSSNIPGEEAQTELWGFSLIQSGRHISHSKWQIPPKGSDSDFNWASTSSRLLVHKVLENTVQSQPVFHRTLHTTAAGFLCLFRLCNFITVEEMCHRLSCVWN